MAAPVVVVGAGCAGLIAALAARRRGARVELVDVVDPLAASPAEESNTSRSTGLIPAAGTRLQRSVGVTDDSPELQAEEIIAANRGQCDKELVLEICRAARDSIDWLDSECGLGLQCFTDFLYHGHSKFRMHGPREGYGRALVEHLARLVGREPLIRRHFGCRATGLLLASTGAVCGIRFEAKSPEEGSASMLPGELRGRAVVLATSGFGANRTLLRQYVDAEAGANVADAWYQGSPHNRGDGLLWGQHAGGSLRHMASYQGHATVTDSEQPMLVTYAVIVNGGVLVNRQGRRFGNENVGYSEFSAAVLAEGPGVLELFGSATFSMCRGTRLDQVVEAGLVSEYKDLRAVAEAYSLTLSVLENTAEAANASISAGHVDAFGRNWTSAPLLEPPYYAIRVKGALFHTQGGLIVDGKARVVAARDTAQRVPGLFAAGGVAAGVSGDVVEGYLSGNGLLTAVALGRLAGEGAAERALGLAGAARL